MKQLVKEAIAAGALGFSTSRTIAHIAIDGEPVPGTFAAEDELFGIGSALGEFGTGVFELAPAGSAGEDIVGPKKEVDWMRRLSAAIRRPVTFALLQVDAAPELWRELMDESLRAVAEGADLWPQVAGRATGLLSGHFTTYSLFDLVPAYQELKAKGLSPEEFVEALRTPEVRRVHRVVGARRRRRGPHGPGLPHHLHPGQPSRVRARARALAGRHRRRHRPVAVARWPTTPCSRTTGGDCCTCPSSTTPTGTSPRPARCCSTPGLPPDWPTVAPTAGSSATPVSPRSCSPTGPATAIRGDRLPLEWVVKKQTHDTARLYGLGDRGTIEVGAVADLNLIDYEHLQLGNPMVVADLPAGGKRIVQDATGYVETIKSGITTFADGQETGARPGSPAARSPLSRRPPARQTLVRPGGPTSAPGPASAPPVRGTGPGGSAWLRPRRRTRPASAGTTRCSTMKASVGTKPAATTRQDPAQSPVGPAGQVGRGDQVDEVEVAVDRGHDLLGQLRMVPERLEDDHDGQTDQRRAHHEGHHPVADQRAVHAPPGPGSADRAGCRTGRGVTRASSVETPDRRPPVGSTERHRSVPDRASARRRRPVRPGSGCRPASRAASSGVCSANRSPSAAASSSMAVGPRWPRSCARPPLRAQPGWR